MAQSVSRRRFMRAGGGLGLAAVMSSRIAAASARKPRVGAPLRVACIGLGGRGMHLLGHVLATPNVHVAAVCDVDPERVKRAQEIVRESGQDRPEGLSGGPYTYRELAGDKEFHACVVATPCYWHSTMYVDLLEAGMHFYGEKPLAITAWGVEAVRAAAEKNPEVVAQIGFQWGAHGARRDILRRVREEGLIGELLKGDVQRLNGWDQHGGWYADRARSGDWMLEQAVHEFNLIWMTVGKHPLSAFTAGRDGIIPGRNTTNYYHTILEYPDNLVVSYAHGWIQVPGFPGGDLFVRFTGRDGAVDVMDAFAQLRRPPQGAQSRVPGEGPGGDTREHFANFFAAVREADPGAANCGIANGVGASYLGLVIRQSLESGRKVTLAEALTDTRRPPLPPA